MIKIKKGDIVARNSYGRDILFKVDELVKARNGKNIAMLKGLTIRIEADAPIEDLVIVKKENIENNIKNLDSKIEERVKKCNKPVKRKFLLRSNEQEKCGVILHLDGDKRYSEKSAKYYKKMQLNAIVRYVPENRQEYVIVDLLNRYNPDVLVITGHDGMLKNGIGYNDIGNYRNSKYFVNTVIEAKKWMEYNKKDIAIFAGACQSYYEALVAAGANFASSPARILIDFVDPLVVAEKIATTEDYKYITINDIVNELRDGIKGINGTGARGKKQM